MVIREITAEGRPGYDGSSVMYGSIFTGPEWSGLFGDRIARYGLYAGGGLIGGFYLYREKRFGLSVCCNPPLTPSTGLFFRDDTKNPAKAMDKSKEVMSLMAEFIDGMNYPLVSLSFDKDTVDMQPFIWRDFKVVPQYTYVMDLSRSGDDIWRGMSGEKRNDITRAAKDGLEVRKINDYAIVKSLVQKTFSRQKKEIEGSGLNGSMNKVLFDFANEDNSFAFAAFGKDGPVACTFCVHDGKTAYYLLGGYDSARRHHGAGAMCIWESILHAKRSLSLPYFDFEGSMVRSIERYFRGFGGRLTPYYRVNKARLPIEIALKFFKRRLF